MASALHGTAGEVGILRQQAQGGQVVWDMPVSKQPSPLTLAGAGTLYQFWSVESLTAEERLMDQKRVASYLPAAEIQIQTLDPHQNPRRTRIDQPFTVKIDVDGLLTGAEFPLSASSVLLERHLVSGKEDRSAEPAGRAYIDTNGSTVLRFEASSVTAADPTKARGEERFVIHALPDGAGGQTQIASASVQVLPVASGAIRGIAQGETIKSGMPRIELELTDLYPRSNSHLILFEGKQINGHEGETLKSHGVDAETTADTLMRVTDLDSKIPRNGTYTLALVSDTIYGRELLCDPVTFSVNRTLPAEVTAASTAR